MSRRRHVAVLTVAALAVTAVSATGASAKAKPKPKVKTLKGTYSVTLLPDPTIEAQGQLGNVCGNVNPKAADSHVLNLPGNGTLQVVLDSPDPTTTNKTDWDLIVFDAAGGEIDHSDGATSHEETYDPGLHKGKVTIKVCNLAGAPDATVHYVYTYH